MTTPQLLTVSEYAAIVRQHEQTIYRRIRLNTQPGLVRLSPRAIRIDITIAIPGYRLNVLTPVG